MSQKNLLYFTDFAYHSWNLLLISLFQPGFYRCGAQEQLAFPTLLRPTSLDLLTLNQTIIFASNLRNIFLEYRALGLKLLSFSTLEILFHGLLASIDLNSDFFNLKIYVFQSFDYEEQRSDFLRIYPPWRLLG